MLSLDQSTLVKSKTLKGNNMSEISESFLAFQKELKPLVKDSENPFFHSKYLELSDILTATIPLLNKHGLSLMQKFRIEGDKNILVTVVFCVNGGLFTSEIILPFNADPQKQGSLISYYKRYAIQSMLGIAAVDDDGNLASDKPVYDKPYQPKEPVKEKLASTARLKFILDLAKQKNTVIDNPESLTSSQAAALIKKLQGSK